MTKGGKLIEGIFEGETINTPSMLAVEDYLDALDWAQRSAASKGLIARADANTGARRLGGEAQWVDFLAGDPAIRSNTSVCLKVVDPAVAALSNDAAGRLRQEDGLGCWRRRGVALDIGGYRDAPPGLRIWCGATVEAVRPRSAHRRGSTGRSRPPRPSSTRPCETTAASDRCPCRSPSPGSLSRSDSSRRGEVTPSLPYLCPAGERSTRRRRGG